MATFSASARRALLLLFLLSSTLLLACQRQPAPALAVNAVKLLVDTNGIYRVSLSSLQEAGLAVDTLDPEQLRLAQGGEPVAYHLDRNHLIFYGQASQSRYTPYRPYVLTIGEPGEQMPAQQVTPSGGVRRQHVTRTLHLEENYEYVSDAHIGSQEGPWYWQTIQIQGQAALDFTLPPVGDGSGSLSIRLYGSTHNPATNPDHSLAVTVNDQEVDTVTWEGQVVYTATVSLPLDTLRSGENRLLLENAPEDYVDIMKLDWVHLDYQGRATPDADGVAVFEGVAEPVTLPGFDGSSLIFDVADPGTPRLLTGWQQEEEGVTLQPTAAMAVVAVGTDGYRAPSAITPLAQVESWRDQGRQADLIIIATEALAPALTPLVEAREAQGLSVALVPVVEIYDTFGHGEASPESITAFLTYAAEAWRSPSPRYLLLVGDATTDYHSYLTERPENPVSPPENVIPPYLVPVNFSGETVSDARLADVDGDRKPDLGVGRWPVDSVEAVAGLVERTLAYEDGEATGQALFAADNSSDEFMYLTERLLENSQLPETQAKLLAGPSASEVAREWNKGTWLVTYMGHGSLKLWGKESIFSIDSIGELHEGAAAPIVLQLTCLSGLFAHPEIVSLSEALLTHKGGPVLTIAATSLTLSAHQEPFATRFLQALHDPEVERVGDALLLAKEPLDLSHAGLREISDTFGLLGDPSALIVRPTDD